MIPNAPLRDTAAVMSPKVIKRMAPWMMGYSEPSISVIRFFISSPEFNELSKNREAADAPHRWILFRLKIIFFSLPSQPIKKGRHPSGKLARLVELPFQVSERAFLCC
jgi:hypothetical protein